MRNVARGVVELTGDLARVLGKYERDAAAIRDDPRLPDLRPEVAREQVQETSAALNQQNKGRVLELTRQLWGNEADLSRPLVGGQVWAELDGAAAALRRAKTESGSRVDWARLESEARRLPVAFRAYRSLDEVEKAYTSGGDYERLALAQIGADFLPRRFANDTGVGAFVSRLEADRAEFFTTPAVKRAQAAVEAADVAALGAWQQSTRASKLFGGGGPFEGTGSPGAVLGRVAHTYRVEPSSMVESHTFSRRGGRVLTRAALAVASFGK